MVRSNSGVPQLTRCVADACFSESAPSRRKTRNSTSMRRIGMKWRGARTHIATDFAPPSTRSSEISAAEFPLPTTSTERPANGRGFRYSALCSTRPRNASRPAISGHFGTRFTAVATAR